MKCVTIYYILDGSTTELNYSSSVNPDASDEATMQYFTANRRFCTGWPHEDENATKTKVVLKDEKDKVLRAFTWPKEGQL